MTPLATIFATAILWCAGPSVSAEKCTTKWIEAPHLVTIRECHEAAFDFIEHMPTTGGATVRGIKCVKLGDLMDAND